MNNNSSYMWNDFFYISHQRDWRYIDENFLAATNIVSNINTQFIDISFGEILPTEIMKKPYASKCLRLIHKYNCGNVAFIQL